MGFPQPDAGRAPLDGLFRARSIALVGATERSAWSHLAFNNFGRLGYGGRLHAVTRRGGVLQGLAAAPSWVAIGEPVDAALLMVPVAAMAETFLDLRDAGIRNAVVLAAGFAESGEDAGRRQAELIGLAREIGLTLLGPNCLGFVNFVDRVPLWTSTIEMPPLPGSIGLVSQSGATASYIAAFAQEHGIGFSYIVSTGNEADVTVARVAAHLAGDPATRVIALFLESVRDRDMLVEAAHLARAARKPIVVLKVGTSEAAAEAAAAHTGSLVGDDRVFDAACAELGILRTGSIEDLVFTAALLAETGPIVRRSVGLIAISGGVCEIAADRAAIEQVPLARLEPVTTQRLQEILPEFGAVHNPLDVTGAAVLDPTLYEKCVRAFAEDPAMGFVACFSNVASEAASPIERKLLTHIGLGMAGAATPCMIFSVTPRLADAGVRALVEASGVRYLSSGVHHGMAAIGAAFRWSQWLERAVPTVPVAPESAPERPRSERETLDFLGRRGVHVIPAILAKDARAAIAAATGFGGPVALKIASPDIAHKSDIGGVMLGLRQDGEIALAFEAILDNARRAMPEARLDGVLVSPMRDSGIELLVGVLCDPHWGKVIAVGLGGIWVELLKDTSLRLLPVTEVSALDMLAELRGTRLLDGYRGAPAVDRRAIARAIVAIGDAALALGPELAALEVNPLLAGPEGVEALDALAVWRDPR